MKEFNIDGIIDFNDEQETIKLINLAKQNQDKQTERIKSANEFNFDNINYNKSINNLLQTPIRNIKIEILPQIHF